jgi:hypothetical protein
VKVFGFDDSDAIAATYQIGFKDGTAGFAPFEYSIRN